MSLPHYGLHPVPVETTRVAHAAFPDGNVYVRLRDELGTLFDDELFTAVYSIEGQPALHPWQLALVSVMRFMVNLSDWQAVQAVRARIDWKYALGLGLTEEGFHYSMLSEFRTRLVQGSIEQVLLRYLAQALSKTGLTQSPRPPAHGLDRYSGSRQGAQPARTGRRDPPACAQYTGHRRARVAQAAGQAGLV